jgi:hypothetical protein
MTQGGPLSESTQEAIATALGRPLDRELREELFALFAVVREGDPGDNRNEIRRALSRVEKASKILAQELESTALTGDDATLRLTLLADQIGCEALSLDDAKRAAVRLSAKVGVFLGSIGRKKKVGRPKDLWRVSLLQAVSDLEEKFAGERTRYTYDPVNQQHSGRLFQLLKQFEYAIADLNGERHPSDAEIAKFLDRQGGLIEETTKPST